MQKFLHRRTASPVYASNVQPPTQGLRQPARTDDQPKSCSVCASSAFSIYVAYVCPPRHSGHPGYLLPMWQMLRLRWKTGIILSAEFSLRSWLRITFFQTEVKPCWNPSTCLLFRPCIMEDAQLACSCSRPPRSTHDSQIKVNEKLKLET